MLGGSVFGNKALERQVVQLSTQVSDLLSLLERLQKEWNEERKGYLDRIMALSQPAAIRILNPTPRRDNPTVYRPQVHLPGYRPNLRPPVPSRVPPDVPPSSSPSGLSDLAAREATISNAE